jgi:hypothetical protein
MRNRIFALITPKISLYREMYLLASLSLCLFISCPPASGGADRSMLSIDFQGTMIELKAENVTLESIFKAISERAGISYNLDESMTELYSGDFKVPIEECIRRLLKNRNYILFYKNKGTGQIALSEVYVVTSKTVIRGNETMSSLEEGPNQKYNKQWIEKEFGDGKKLASEISAGPSGKGIDNSGISITKIEENSFFQKIGLRSGDTVYDVNGHTIYTPQEFIKILQSVSKTEPMIRIERSKADNSNAPIYMELH